MHAPQHVVIGRVLSVPACALRLTVLAFVSLLVQQHIAEAQSSLCRTPLGIPCYTIRGTHKQWQAFANGLTDIHQFKRASVSALRRDGSNIRLDDNSEGGLFGTSGSYRIARLYLAPENTIITLDHMQRTIARREPLIWHDLPYRRSEAQDATCQSGIKHSGTDFKLAGQDKIAGIPVVKWHREFPNGREEQYLAPSLDCTALKTSRIQTNSWWIPTFIDSWEANLVELGEPARELFTLPSGYRAVEDPQRDRLIRFLEVNRSRPGGPVDAFPLRSNTPAR